MASLLLLMLLALPAQGQVAKLGDAPLVDDPSEPLVPFDVFACPLCVDRLTSITLRSESPGPVTVEVSGSGLPTMTFNNVNFGDELVISDPPNQLPTNVTVTVNGSSGKTVSARCASSNLNRTLTENGIKFRVVARAQDAASCRVSYDLECNDASRLLTVENLTDAGRGTNPLPGDHAHIAERHP